MIVCICSMMPTSAILNAKKIEQELTAFDASPGDYFGCAVAISDRFAVIGAYGNDYSPESSDYTLVDVGSVYVYQFNGNTWELQQKIIPEKPKNDMNFGSSVALDNEYIAVGANYENGDELSGSDASELTYSGAAYIYKYNGIRWVQEARLLPDDVGAKYSFGTSISLSGNYVIVGCNAKKPFGAAYIFINNQGNWTQQQMLTSGQEDTYVRFGFSVSISGDYACVGADQDYNDDKVKTGAAYIYKREYDTWTFQKRLIDKEGKRSDGFGKSVSISGDYILVGASGHDGLGRSAGMAYYSIRDETGWSDPLKLSGDAGHVAGIKFGQSVSISENGAVIGASLWNGTFGERLGAVFTYVNKDGTLIKSNLLYINDGQDLDSFGKRVAMHNKHIVVGAPGRIYQVESGAAYIFTETDGIHGDINNNNVIDIMDAVLLLKKLIK